MAAAMPSGSSQPPRSSAVASNSLNGTVNGRLASQERSNSIEGGAVSTQGQRRETLTPSAQNHFIQSPTIEQNGTPHLSHVPDRTAPYDQLTALIKQTDSATVRQVIRDQWEKCLLGSDFHVSFLLLATIHNASQNILKTVIQKNGPKIIQASRDQIAGHMSMEDLDSTSNILLSKASDEFLDNALNRRLETIPARKLLNALARAERLGYDVDDMLTEDGSTRRERVTPSAKMLAVPNGLQQPPPAARPPEATQTITLPPKVPVPDNLPIWARVCSMCNRICASDRALRVHLKKSACHSRYSEEDYEKNSCPFCGCGFVTKAGLGMHTKGNVCGEHSQSQLGNMLSLLHAGKEWQEKNMHLATTMVPTAKPIMKPSVKPTEMAHSVPGGNPPPRKVSSYTAVSAPSDPVGVPLNSAEYRSLGSGYRATFEAELLEAQNRYGPEIIKAEAFAEPERTDTITKFKNRWNTKASNTRKKYGISLRGTRAKGIDEYLQQPSKRRRTDDTPANSSAPQGSAQRDGVHLNPRKLTRVSDMGGGLTGASATAETEDPMTYITQGQPRYSQAGAAPNSRTPGNDHMVIDSGQTSADVRTSSDEGDILS